MRRWVSAPVTCGIDAETLGSLMMLHCGVVASTPSSARVSGTRCVRVRVRVRVRVEVWG